MVKKTRAIFIFKTFVLGAFGLSRVASALPISTNDHVAQVQTWQAVKDEMAPHSQGKVPLSQHIVDVIATTDLQTDLVDTIELTYAMVSVDEIESLDALWMDVIAAAGEASAIATYMSVRATLIDPIVGESVESMVWLTAQGGNGCDDNCNNGGGNGGEECDATDNPNSNDDGDRGGGGGGNNGGGQGGGQSGSST